MTTADEMAQEVTDRVFEQRILDALIRSGLIEVAPETEGNGPLDRGLRLSKNGWKVFPAMFSLAHADLRTMISTDMEHDLGPETGKVVLDVADKYWPLMILHALTRRVQHERQQQEQ